MQNTIKIIKVCILYIIKFLLFLSFSIVVSSFILIINIIIYYNISNYKKLEAIDKSGLIISNNKLNYIVINKEIEEIKADKDEEIIPPDYPDILKNSQKPIIPVLMYHQIGDSPSENYNVKKYYVREKVFDQQMRYLKEMNIKTLSIEEYLNLLRSNIKGISNTVLITFDDGPLNNYSIAYPILKKYQLKATFFIISNKSEISTKELKEMSDNGMDIESHSKTHPNLSIENYFDQEPQIRDSKYILQNAIEKSVDAFAYPGCTANRSTFSLLSKYNYKLGFTCTWPYGVQNTINDRYRISRIHVFDSLTSLKEALTDTYPN